MQFSMLQRAFFGGWLAGVAAVEHDQEVTPDQYTLGAAEGMYDELKGDPEVLAGFLRAFDAWLTSDLEVFKNEESPIQPITVPDGITGGGARLDDNGVAPGDVG
jgi:hypothetical protein